MLVKYYREYSASLDREMGFKVYGHAGKPCIAFPPLDGNFYDFEDHGIIDSISSFIEDGKLQVFCVQSIDSESWSSSWDSNSRIIQHEAWFAYICDELLPRLYSIHNTTSNTCYTGKFMTLGASLGAYHALNFLLRRPNTFDCVIALSGIYHADYFFPNYNDERIYLNSPIDSLNNIDINHPYIEMYRQCKIVICCGQGNWEDESIKDAYNLKASFTRLKIPTWIDFWGDDVDQDWYWWNKELPYYLDKIL